MREKIQHLLQWCSGDAYSDFAATALVDVHKMESDAINASSRTLEEKADAIDTLDRSLFDGLLDLFVSDLSDDVFVPTSTEPPPSAEPAHVTSSPPPSAEPTTQPTAMQLMIAKEATLAWRQHVATFVKLWDRVRVMGFVCADQAELPALLEHVSLMRNITRQ